MLRYYYASLALSLSLEFNSLSLSALFFRLPSILKSVFVCLLFFCLPLSASQHTPTTTLNPYRTITAFCCSSISALFFFVFLLLSVSA